MAATRQERFLMRQRGAGARELIDDDFGFAVPGALTAQRARRTPGSNSSTASRATRGVPSSRTSVQLEVTFVDENGSVVKKRRLTPARNTVTTPAQDATTNVGPGVVTGSQKASSGRKRKKRKSIGQGSLFKKRSSGQPRISAPTEVEDPVVDEIEAGDGELEVVDDVVDLPEEPVAAQRNHDDNTQAPRPANAGSQAKTTDPQPYRRRQKARKSTGGPVRRTRPTSPVASTSPSPMNPLPEPEPEPTGEPSPHIEQEDDTVQDLPIEDDENEGADADLRATAEPQADNDDDDDAHDESPPAPIAAKTMAEPKRKRRRKSVNPIQQERKKYRSSLESTGSTEPPSVQPSARPTTRKLAITQPRPKPIVTKAQQPRRTFTERGASRGVPALQRKTASSKPKTVESNKPKADSVPITVFRLQNAPRLSPIPEEAEEDDSRPSEPAMKRPNAIDALAQVCGDLIQAKVEVVRQAEEQADGRPEKATARRKRIAIEAFGHELEARLLDMTQAVDNHNSVQARLRQAKKTRKTLRAQLLTSRREEDELAGATYQLRAKRDLAEKVAEEDKQIVTLYKKLGRAIRDARNAQQDDEDLTPEGLDYELRNVERFSTADGRQGLLGAMKALNASLETIAGT